jgi:VanZ family protein
MPSLRRVGLWLPPLVYMAAIFHFSSQSHPLPALTEHVWDKLLHTVEYAGLAVLVFRALDGEGLGAWRSAILTVVVVSAYGATDEWHQMFVPLRDSDVFDWLTDTLAGAIGAAAYLVVQHAYNDQRRAR